ncbi:MAG: family 78 glycoside hydrolase catalytic domain [Tunicatimonas sp.]|uniref:family 78 glycoside hydrolase catalytic domain n=1 Tax=Tunicatimonas sp. TaxID=1940096 RepID=UPI003C78A0E7
MYIQLTQALILTVVSLLLYPVIDSFADNPNPPSHLQTEYRANPLSIDTATPRLSWVVSGSQRNITQTAYQILVGSSAENVASGMANIWDSGKITSDQSISVAYAGPPVQPHTRYYWTVRIWDNRGNQTDYAEPVWWEIAKLAESDWEAQWIGDGRPAPEQEEDMYDTIPAPLFRKAFQLNQSVEKARLYISGLGYYEAELNGEKVGDQVLDPGWTNYGERILYSTYDVTSQVQQGKNALGVALGNGWYNPLPLGLFRRFNLRKFLTIGQPKFIAELHVWHTNGSKTVVASDNSWMWDDGPLLENNIYLGETYDARREQPGWSTASFSAESWQDVILAEPPGGKLVAQMAPPIRITQTIKPISVTQPDSGIYVFDLGQNFAGWIRLNLNGEVGTTVKMHYGELLFDNGRVNGLTTVAGHIKEAWNLSGGPGAPPTAYQEDYYTLKGGGEEIFQQKFGFQAFRYVEVSGYSGKLSEESLVGLRLNSDLPDHGSFACSNDLFNEIQEVTEWTMLSNVFSIQSDCPGREKFGYGGDIVTAAEAYIYNYDMANFYRKAARDFQDDVRPNGGLPETAPYNGIDTQGFGEGSGPIGWQLAHPFVVQQLYRYYGDRQIVEEQYPVAKRALEFLQTQAPNHYIENGIGDHVSLSYKAVPLTSTAFYYHFAQLVAEFAEILNHKKEAQTYQQLAQDIETVFNQRFVNSNTGQLDSAITQANQVFGLYYGLGLDDPELKEKAQQVLLDNILQTEQGHLTTGIFSTKMMWDVLDQLDQNDVAYTINNQRDFPSYGHMLEQGATTLWETWKEPNQASWNHPMFGSVSEWFYQSILGIQPAENAVGMDHVLIKPSLVGELTFARGHYQSVRGEIAVDWERKGEDVQLKITIPGNTTATFALPVAGVDNPQITEGETLIFTDSELKNNQNFSLVSFNDQRVFLQAGSGTYSFTVKPGNR